MAGWPIRGLKPWDGALKAYIDSVAGGSLTVVNGGTVTMPNEPEGTLRAYRVKSDTMFIFDGQETVLTPGAYSLERSDIGWLIYKAANGYLLGTVPDSTPPTTVTGLVATGGEAQIAVNWNDATDAESDVSYGYRAWLTSAGSSGAWLVTNTSDATITDLPAGDYTVQVYATSAGGSSPIVSATATVVPVPGWNTYDTLTAAQIGADGDRGTTVDIATTGGRTFRWESTGGTVSVLDGYLRGPRDNQQTYGYFVANGPMGDYAVEFDYNALGDAGNGYLSSINWAADQEAAGSSEFTLESDWRGDGTLAVSIGATFGTQPVITPGPGQTLRTNGISVALGGSSGRLRFEKTGQILSVYRNDTLLLSADHTNCVYSGNPNTLVVPGGFNNVRAKNLAGISNIEWEVYS